MHEKDRIPDQNPMSKEEAINAVSILLNKFLTSSPDSLAQIRDEAMSLSNIISILNPDSTIQNLEKAGDKLVVLIGHIYIIEKGWKSLEEVKDKLRTSYL